MLAHPQKAHLFSVKMMRIDTVAGLLTTALSRTYPPLLPPHIQDMFQNPNGMHFVWLSFVVGVLLCFGVPPPFLCFRFYPTPILNFCLFASNTNANGVKAKALSSFCPPLLLFILDWLLAYVHFVARSVTPLFFPSLSLCMPFCMPCFA
jgi:hypothetical protein